MLADFLPVVILLVLGTGMAAGLLIVSSLLGQKKPAPEKNDAYECGVPLFEGARKRYSIKFFIVAVMFILFDIEVAFLYPWAVFFRKLGLFGFVEMAIFVIILLVGFVYIWRKGALEWE